jgi:hypothetical protein
MKSKLLLILCAAVAAPLSAAGAESPKPVEKPAPQFALITLDSTFFTISASAARRLGLTPAPGNSGSQWPGILSTPAYEKLLRSLNAEKSMKLLSSPSVTTKTGQRAVVEVLEEFRYPTAFGESADRLAPTEFVTVNTGLKLEVEPVLGPADDLIALTATTGVTDFNRFVTYADGRTQKSEPLPKGGFSQPVFDRTQNTASAGLRPGQTMLLGGSEWTGASGLSIEGLMHPGAAKPAADANAEPELLFVTVTAWLAAGLAGPMTEGGPIEITSEIVNISRDRLPASMKVSAAGPTTLAGVFTSADAQEVRKALIANSGGEYSAAPKKAIAPGGRFSVEATGLLRYPGKDAKTDGRTDPEAAAKSEMERMDFRIEVRPHAFQAGVIDLDITSSPTTSPASNEDPGLGSSAGMASAKWKFDDDHSSAAREPARSITTSVSIFDASTVVLARATEGREDHLQILLITAKSVNADERAKADAKKWPSALPVPGRPGFVTSPFKPAADIINVRGYPKGAELKDPYTGRTFLVP